MDPRLLAPEEESAVSRLLHSVLTIIDHTRQVLSCPESTHPALTQDIGLSYRDRTRNFLPFTSVTSLTRAYRQGRISQGLYEQLDNEDAIAEYRQIRLSQVITHFNREVNTLSAQEARVMTMALAEIISRTLFFALLDSPVWLDEISLLINNRLSQLPGYLYREETVRPIPSFAQWHAARSNTRQVS